MIIADLLSKRVDHIPTTNNDNNDVIMLPNQLFVNIIDLDLQNKIANDTNATTALEALKKEGPMEIKNALHDWRVEEFKGQNVLFFRNKVYIPNDGQLRKEITRQYHDSRTVGHPGELKTFNAIREHYFWPQMQNYVKKYVEGCPLCQQFKIDRHPANPAFQPTLKAVDTRPFANCSIDVLTDLPPI
jgi:hypothetical protein